MREAIRIAVAAVVLLGFAGTGLADSGYRPGVEMFPKGSGLQWNALSGEYRFVYHHMTSFVLDRVGTAGPMQDWGEHRIRWAPAFSWGRVGIKADMDIMEGQLFGDHENFSPEYRRLDRRDQDYGATFDNLLLRQLYLQFYSPIGLLKMGQMSSSYGLGILANSGDDDDSRFGVRRHGDIVDRLLLMTAPFKKVSGGKKWGEYLTFVLSGDIVYRDENAIFSDGDRGYQLNGGIYFRHPRHTNGLIFTWRTQTDSDGDELEAFAFNLNGKNRFVLTRRSAREEAGGKGGGRPDLSLYFNYEAVWLTGSTTRFQQLGSPEGLSLNSLGAVARFGLNAASIGLTGEVEVGYASGDNNPYDDESHAFFFDPDYNVGMVFFDEMLPLITARSVEISSDPAHLDTVPKGLDLVPSQGRVTNAFYILPHVRYTLLPQTPYLEKVQLLAGALFLTTPARFMHSYYSFEKGGVAANHLGRETDSNYLGTEILAGLRLKIWPWPEHIGMSVRTDLGFFIPGMALADPAGNKPDNVWKVSLGTALHWQ